MKKGLCAIVGILGLLVLGPSIWSQPDVEANPKEILDLVDFRNIGLAEATRILSLQTGMKIVPTAEAGKTKVTLFLSKVSPDVVIQALADSNHFIVDREADSGVIALMTKKEHEEKQNKTGYANKPVGEKPYQGMTAKTPGIPLITVKGRIIEKDSVTTAILEVGGKLMYVTKNSMISIDANVTIRVEEVTGAEVRLMILPQKELLIVQ